MPRFEVDSSDEKPLGKTGEKVPAIGLGTWRIRNYDLAFRAFVEGISLGLRMIDTAEIYDAGRAEEFVGRVVREVGRDNVFITTKLTPGSLRSPDRAVRAAEASLRRLGVAYVDLVLAHWPELLTPVERLVASLEAIADRGYTRYIGVSNFSASQLSKAMEASRRYEIVVNQVKYSPLDRAVEKELLPMMIREGVTMQAYTPLEGGAVARDPRLARIGARYGKSPVQVALNFLISRPYVTAIPKSERPERVKEFRGALGWRLSPEDIEAIERL